MAPATAAIANSITAIATAAWGRFDELVFDAVQTRSEQEHGERDVEPDLGEDDARGLVRRGGVRDADGVEETVEEPAIDIEGDRGVGRDHHWHEHRDQVERADD